MIIEKQGDLIEEGILGNVDVIVHQANLQHTFGAGIAAAIRERLPYALRADKTSKYDDLGKLGHFTYGVPDPQRGEDGPDVVNLYSQVSLYPSVTSYDAMFGGLTRLRKLLEKSPSINSVGFPVKMGSGLANGKWPVVKAIILAVFEESRLNIHLVEKPEPANNPITDVFVNTAIDALKAL
jgi:O-acetyl-ADP-ribose deacetylase (regulator of RNase III)